MFTFKRLFLVFIFALIPMLGICQIDVPKWVDDIGSSNSNCISSAVQVDKQNNIYVTGFFNGTADFDPSPAVYNLTASGTFDTFVAKYTTDGKLIWAVSFGGSSYTQVNSMAVDKDGNVVVSGQYDSTIDADPGSGTYFLSSGGDYNAFLVKLNTNGGFVWAKSIGGDETDYGSHVGTDSQGNVIECVRYQGTASVGNKNYTAGGSDFNGLTIKYDVAGNVIWAINISDPGDSEVFGDIDSQDNVIIGGHFQNNDNFNPLGAAFNLNGNGNSEFVAKYTAAGILVWVQSFAGVLDGNNINIATDSQGNVFADGPFTSSLDFNGKILNNTGTEDVFLVKYSSTGVFQSVKDIGQAGGSIFNYGIHSTKDDYLFVSGYFSGQIDFDPSPSTAATITAHGQRDFFLAKYDNNLNYKWAFSGGSPGCNQSLGRNNTVDNNNNVLFTGGFCSTVDFSGSACSPYPLTAQSSSRDCFLGKYIQNTATPTAQITGFSVPQQTSAAVIDQTNLKITVTVPIGTNVTALVPTIVYTSGITLSPASGVAKDFTSGVTYTLSTSCSTLNYTVNIVFASTPKPLTVCSSVIAQLTGDTDTPTPGSYLWQTLQNGTWVNASGTNTGKDYQVALTNSGNTNLVFSFRRQNTTGSAVTYDSYFDVTVLPAISGNTITAPSLITFCTGGDPATIVGSVPSGGTGTYTYQWQSSADGISFVNISGATSQSYDPPLLNATTYYQRVLTSGTCTPAVSNMITITISPPPEAPTFITQQICTGGSITLTIAGQNNYTYNWYDSPAKTNLLITGLAYTTGPVNSNTTFYIEAFNGTCGSASLATATVNVIPLPAAPTVVNNNVQTCQNMEATLSVSDPQPGYTYNWYNTATGGTSIFTGPTYVFSPVTSSTLYVDVYNASGCYSSTRTAINITVIPLPDAPPVTTPVAVCSGSATTLYIAKPEQGFIYRWYNTATGGTPLTTGNQFNTPALTANATYYADAVNRLGGCISSARTAVIVPVTPLPAAPASFSQQVCSGSPATLIITDAQAAFTYNWYDSPSKNNLLFTGTSYTLSGVNQNTTFYIEAFNGTCPATTLATAQAVPVAAPGAPAIVNNALKSCAGTQITIAILNPQSGYTYNWYTDASGGTAVFTGSSFTTPLLTANITYYAEAVNATGCPSALRTPADIQVIPIASVTAQGASVCPGTSAILSASSSNASAIISWYTSATGGNALTTGFTFTTPALTANTVYYAGVQNADGCAVTTRALAQVIVLQQLAAPVVTVSATTPSSVTFEWAAVPGATGYQVSLDNGSTFIAPSSGNTGLSHTVDNLQPQQSVTIIVEATGLSLCQLSGSSTAVTAIAQYPQNDIVYIPNAFTPNGDGKNDVVFVHGNNIKSLTFNVYDQWGELIFSSANQLVGWDGTFKGKRQPVGAYVYYVQAILNTGDKVNKKGTITLLR